MDGLWSQSTFGLRISRRAVVDHHRLLVSHIVGFEVIGGKSHEALAGVMFVGNCKTGVKGEGLAATGTSESNQRTKSGLDQHFDDDQKLPFPVCVDLEQA